MVSMKEILDKNPKYDHKEHTKKQRDSFKRLKDKTKKFVKDNAAKIEMGAIVTGILGGTLAGAKRISGNPKNRKDYFSKKKYIDPRKVQKPDNLDF